MRNALTTAGITFDKLTRIAERDLDVSGAEFVVRALQSGLLAAASVLRITPEETPMKECPVPTVLEPLLNCMSRAQILSLPDCGQKKIAIWSGAVSAGKTYVSLYELLFAILDAPKSGRIIIVGRTLDTIQTNLFTLLTDPAIFGELTKHISYTPGAKTAVIRGMTVALAYVDEATILPEGFWDILITRLRVSGARCLATTNPGSKNHWLRKKWILKAAEKNFIRFTFTMDDNPSLEADYIEDMKRSYAGILYQRMIRGEWTNAAGAVYPMWDEKRHLIAFNELPDIARTLAVGIDYGTTNTTAALLLGITDEPQPRLVLIDEWHYSSAEHHGESIPDVELSKQLRAWLKGRHAPEGVYVPPPEYIFLDPSAASMRAQLHADGVTPWPADNAVLDGIADIASLLGQGKLIVTDRCEGFLSEVTEYEWDAKASDAGEDAVVKRDDHFMDAARCAIRSTIGQWQHVIYALAA